MAPVQRAHINPRVLRWARESSFIMLPDAADRLGIPSHRLASWETGDAMPTVRQAQSAAALYKRPFAALFLSAPPDEDPPPPDFRRLPDGGIPDTSPDLAAEIRRAHYRRDAALTLVRALEVEVPEIPMLAVDFGNVEREAANLRVQLEVPLRPAWRNQYDALNAWKSAIESRGILVFHFSGVSVAEARGFSIAARPLPAISVNGEDSPHGRIFSLLHEYSHVLVGEGGNCNFVDYFQTANAAGVERFCNALAAAILLPANDLLQHPAVVAHGPGPEWSDDELASISATYRVSREAAMRRLLTLGRTTPAEYRRRREEWTTADQPMAGGGFMTWPQRAIRSAGHLFGGLVLDAYRQEAITTADVAEYLGVRIKHLPEIERRLEGRTMLTGGRP